MASRGPQSRPGLTSVTTPRRFATIARRRSHRLPTSSAVRETPSRSWPSTAITPCNPRGPYNCTRGMDDPDHYSLGQSLPRPLSRPSMPSDCSLHEAVDWQSRQALRPALLCSCAWSWPAPEGFVGTLAPWQSVRKSTIRTRVVHTRVGPSSRKQAQTILWPTRRHSQLMSYHVLVSPKQIPHKAA